MLKMDIITHSENYPQVGRVIKIIPTVKNSSESKFEK